MPLRLCIHFPEQHLHTEQEQNDAAGHFERVHVNADRVENDLASGHCDHEDYSGVNASTQRRPMPVCPAERSGQPGEKRQGRDRVDRREERREILADLDQERRHMSERVFYPDTDDVSSTSKVAEVAKTGAVADAHRFSRSLPDRTKITAYPYQ